MKHRVKRSLSLLCALAVLVGMMPMSALAVDDGVEPYAAGDTSSVADSATLTSWAKPEGDSLADSSRDTGRIWTDKSVSKENVTLTGDVGRVTINKTEGADFLVGLSALSSASSQTTTTTGQPLDIVLVLDRSGSMSDMLNTPVFADALDREETYYIERVHSDDQSVEWNSSRQAWGYWSWGNWNEVTPKTSENDSSGTQFYMRQSKMDALKAAVGNFIDATANANTQISQQENQHRIAIVSFSSNVNTDRTFTYCTSNNANSLKSAVNRLNANGGTQADDGLERANTVMNSARNNAQKVVIFFTDGGPGGTNFNPFDNDVANDAVDAAKELKDKNVLVYSIGVLEGADPSASISNVTQNSDVSRKINAYMHAVSSNYPDATNFTSQNLGERATDSDYYKAATDATELNSIFQDIFDEVNSGSGSPTNVTENDPHHSGYITFTDKLGEYMEVKDVNAVVYAGQQYTDIDTNDNGATYTVTGEVSGNEIYKEADLSDIKITVDKSGTGDTITVKIPASLIPLRYYDIKTENGQTSMTIRGNAYPIRVFYSVGLKESARSQVESGNYTDTTLQTYVNEHKDAAGAYFYSNAYDAAENRENGSTTAEFTPAETNSFYYFTENTPLYVKNNGNYERATGAPNAQTTYYYPIYYYTEGSDVSEQTYWVAVPGSYLANAQVTGSDDEGIYIREGARRTTRAQAFALPKEEGANETSTASNAISPSWERGMDDSVNRVTVSLGNNGKLTVEPSSGSLKITKNVAAAEGHSLPGDVETKDFSFELKLTAAQGSSLQESYPVKVTDAEGVVSGSITKIDISNGTGTFTLKKDQTIEIFGLSVGDQYTVSESSYTEDGYTTTWTGQTTGSMTDAGVSLTCTNTYQAEKTTLEGDGTTGALKVSKTIAGRDWQEGDSFKFTISADSGNPDTAAIPSPNTVTIDKDDASDNYTDAFGDITFTKPGIYKYSITEDAPGIPGISKDETIYTVTVPVTDNNGQLKIGEVTYQKDGVDYTSYSTDSMKFTNEFSAEQKKVQLNGLKVLNGDRTPGLRAGEFSFKLISVSDGTNTYDADNSDIPEGFPMPANANEIGATVTNDANGYINFGNITFTGDDIGTTYSYTIKEVAQLNQVNGINLMTVEDGITFDETEYTIEVKVSDASTASGAAIQVVPKDENGEAYGLFTVTNKYNTSGTIGDGEGSTAIKVKKVIEGRDWQDGDSFEFTLAAEDGTPMPTSDKVKITNATADHTASFGEITFNKAGIYTYQIAETEGNIGGMTYAKDPVTVTVVVEDDGKGNLTAESITYSDAVDDNAATFTNTYKATGTLVGSEKLQVSKELEGREWIERDNFKVTISSADANVPMPTGGRTIQLNVYNDGKSAFGDINYTEKDIGKTYTYTIKETAGNADGMTYSQAVYEVKVTVAVDPDDASKLDVSSTMTKVKDDDGKTVDEAVGSNTAAFTNTYKADPTNVTIGAGAELTKIFDAGTRGWKDTDEFTFKIAQSTSDKYQIDLDTVVQGVQNEATVTVGKPSSGNTANFTFGPYTFEYADTYHFTVTEQNGGQTIDGITYDGHAADVTVTVEDKGTGKLTATVAISDGKFTNTYGINPGETYELDGDTFLRVVKELEGRGWTDNDRFTFKIEAVGDAPMPDEDTITIGADTPDHAAAFGDITFREEHLTGDATYQYKITEVEGNLPNMQYDNREITVTVKLEDDGNGELDATVTYSGGELKFTNTYVDPGNVSIKPADITIYMGGEDGYEAVVGEDGSTVETNNSLPEPLFYIEMPEGSTGDPLDLIFNSTEEITDPETGEHHTKAWRVSELAGQDSEGNNLYYMEPVYAFQDDVRVQYVNGDTAITNDQFDPSVVNNLFEDFTIELYTGTVNVGGVTAVLEGSDEVYGITTATGTLRVRAVENGDGTESTNPVFGVQSTAPTTRLPSGQAAVVSNAVYYLLNDTTVKVAKDGVGLLFDDIYDSDNGNNERENALIEKTDEVLGSEGSNVTRHYEAKYLDLVDANNGNAWVKTDGETVTVYWPYPTGTDQNTEFDLLHFAGLHRDTDGGLSGYSPDDIDSVTPTAVEWHTDEAGIYFTVESGGFSPFVLVWETTSSSGGSSSSNKPDDLNTEDHFAYIIGYPKDNRTGEPTDDESLWPVEPQGDITRAEVATIFFRMLTDDARSENWSQTNSFTDVACTEWYNNAISTLANMGIISGRSGWLVPPGRQHHPCRVHQDCGRFLRQGRRLRGRHL